MFIYKSLMFVGIIIMDDIVVIVAEAALYLSDYGN